MNDLTSARKRIKDYLKTKRNYLDLGNCGITDLEELPELFECTHLEKLILCFNQISDISFLANLTGLQTLDLSSNQISDISFLANLTGLQNLYLCSNQISDISFLENLTGLQILDLSSNQISDISFLANLTGLQNLYLSNNPISNYSFLENLSKLRYVAPPLDIIKQGKQSVLDWYKAKENKKLKKLNEIKIILIGEPKAGKTSLLKRLKDNGFNENEVQTDGVNIEDIIFGKCKTFKEQTSLHKITGHFWDFGGQEIMNATHQFFLTKRSVYVLILNARKDTNNSEQIRKWVQRVRATGGDSPIIVLANQSDVNTGFGFENEHELQNEFPQIKSFLKISCKTNENIDLFKNKLAEIIPTTELFKTEIDERWITIKNKLQEETKQQYYLNESRFLEICNESHLTEKHEQKNAIRFLHDLGLVLHFDDLNLSEYYVLNPYWITYGAYQILTSKYAGEEKGKVSMDKLEFIVNDEEDKKESYQPANYKKIKYSTNDRRFLIDILNQFKLCFCVPDGSQFIIPDLLDTTEPLDITDLIRQSEKNIQFAYEYDYLPKSVMPNIMVETHQIITDKWRTGCVLQNDGCKALITNYRNRISIIITGEHKKKREFMSIIRFTIDTINRKLSNQPVRLIPLPDVKDGYVKYEVLLGIEKKGEKEYIHDEYLPTEKRISISKLLDGIPNLEGLPFDNKYIDTIYSLAYKNNYKSFFEYFSNYIVNYLSNRDLIGTVEKDIKFLFLPIFFTSNYYLLISELENSEGYSDIYLQRRSNLHPKITTDWVWEIKYIKQSDSDNEKLIEAAKTEAKKQLQRYKTSNLFKDRNDVRYLAVVFVGKKSYTIDEI